MSDIKFTVEFFIPKVSWETVSRIARIEPNWRWCNLDIRMDGKQYQFEADWMRQFCEVVRQQPEYDNGRN